MSNLNSKSDDELLEVLAQSRGAQKSLIKSLEQRQDMQQVIQQLMTPDDMLEAFSKLAVAEPDLMRVVLQAAVAALVNTQAVMAAEAEVKRRAEQN
jgi:hypothetical protein